MLCGITLAAANFVKLILFDLRSYSGTGDPVQIALVVSLTLVGTIIMAKIVGSSLPLLASKIGFDPAVMANPLISTVCDSLSLLIYFAVATSVLRITRNSKQDWLLADANPVFMRRERVVLWQKCFLERKPSPEGKVARHLSGIIPVMATFGNITSFCLNGSFAVT